MNLKSLLKYQMWADSKVQSVIRELSEEEFQRDVGPPFKSVKNLCVHIVAAIMYNVESCVEKNDVDSEQLFEMLQNLSKDELLAQWEEVDRILLNAESKTVEPILFPNFLTGGDILLHADDFFLQYITHTIYHRGQLMSLLKMVGKEGVTTDYLFYLFSLEGQ